MVPYCRYCHVLNLHQYHWNHLLPVPSCRVFFVDRISAYGGIPVGIQGKVLVHLIDRRSAVAAWMMLKRGCELVGYGNEEIRSHLEQFSYGHPITWVSDPEKARDVLAVVFSEFCPEKRDIPSFYPLMGLKENQIQEIMKDIF